MNVHFPKPNEMKIGQLMMHISRMRANMADRIMEQIGLYRGQAFLLKVLAENDGLTHKEIAQILHISPAAVTKVIKRMAGLKYVERRSDPKDERISRVFLTDEGRSVIHKIKQAFEEIDAVLLKDLNEEDRSKFSSLLIHVYDNLSQQSKVQDHPV